MEIKSMLTRLSASLSARLGRAFGKAPAPKEIDTLSALLLETQKAIEESRQGLQFADNEALTDMYIYAIKSSEIRYAHLLQMAKKAVG